MNLIKEIEFAITKDYNITLSNKQFYQYFNLYFDNTNKTDISSLENLISEMENQENS